MPVVTVSPLVEVDRNAKCRVCFANVHKLLEEKVQGSSEVDLLAPCRCTGNKNWVHRSCLNTEIAHAPIEQRAGCTACNYQYNRELKPKSIMKWTVRDVNVPALEWMQIIIEFINLLYYAAAMLYYWPLYQDTVQVAFYRVLTLALWFYSMHRRQRLQFYSELHKSIFYDAVVLDALPLDQEVPSIVDVETEETDDGPQLADEPMEQ